MKVIIPMAGIGDRFVAKGYTDPKPLISVNGKRIIEYIVDMFSEDDEFIFICNEEHLQKTDMKEALLHLKPHAKIFSMPKHKLGPVHTVLTVLDEIKNDEEVMISYCDNPFSWNWQDFKQYVHDNSLDGCVLTHSGFHPHTLASTKMAFIKSSMPGIIDEIQEKQCYTSDPMSEHASTGAYYFKRGDLVKKYFQLQIQNNIHYNGEYYVTLTYNLLIKDGHKIGYYDTPFVTVFGTPEEVQNFEAWATILKGAQVKNEEHLLKCYRYWKEYHAKNNLC